MALGVVAAIALVVGRSQLFLERRIAGAPRELLRLALEALRLAREAQGREPLGAHRAERERIGGDLQRAVEPELGRLRDRKNVGVVLGELEAGRHVLGVELVGLLERAPRRVQLPLLGHQRFLAKGVGEQYLVNRILGFELGGELGRLAIRVVGLVLRAPLAQKGGKPVRRRRALGLVLGGRDCARLGACGRGRILGEAEPRFLGEVLDRSARRGHRLERAAEIPNHRRAPLRIALEIGDGGAVEARHAAGESPPALLGADLCQQFVRPRRQVRHHRVLIEVRRAPNVGFEQELPIDPESHRLRARDPEHQRFRAGGADRGAQVGERLLARARDRPELDHPHRRILDRERTPTNVALLAARDEVGRVALLRLVGARVAAAALVVEGADDRPIPKKTELARDLLDSRDVAALERALGAEPQEARREQRRELRPIDAIDRFPNFRVGGRGARETLDQRRDELRVGGRARAVGLVERAARLGGELLEALQAEVERAERIAAGFQAQDVVLSRVLLLLGEPLRRSGGSPRRRRCQQSQNTNEESSEHARLHKNGGKAGFESAKPTRCGRESHSRPAPGHRAEIAWIRIRGRKARAERSRAPFGAISQIGRPRGRRTSEVR